MRYMQLGCLSVGLDDIVVYRASAALVFITLQGLEPFFFFFFFLHLWCPYFLLLCPFVVSTSHMELTLSLAFGGFWQFRAYDQTVQSTSCCKIKEDRGKREGGEGSNN